MSSKNIITVIIVVVLAALIVFVFINFAGSQSSVNSGLSTVEPSSGSSQVLSRELLSALSSLKDLKLDATFFSDRAFLSLNDYSKDIVDESVGRDNPFLPIAPGSNL